MFALVGHLPSLSRELNGFPLTPSLSPRKFGLSLIPFKSPFVRIFGERGARIMALRFWLPF